MIKNKKRNNDNYKKISFTNVLFEKIVVLLIFIAIKSCFSSENIISASYTSLNSALSFCIIHIVLKEIKRKNISTFFKKL